MKSLSIVLGISLLAQLGCAQLMSRRNIDDKASAVETKDVGATARGESEAPRHRVLVLPFLDERRGTPQQVLDVARQTVVRELIKTQHFVVVSPEDFPQDPKKFMTEENEYDLAQVSRLASAMGVNAVIEGKVLALKAKKQGDAVGLIRQMRAEVSSQVRVRIFAGKNGKEIYNELRSGEADATSTRVAERANGSENLADDPEMVKTAIRKAFVSAIPNIIRSMEKLSWEGRVAMVNGERVFVNAGRLSGLQVGDILKVTEEGEDVYDPETGKFIGAAPGRLKGTVEIVSYFGKDGSIAIIHSGSGFQENDRVELY